MILYQYDDIWEIINNENVEKHKKKLKIRITICIQNRLVTYWFLLHVVANNIIWLSVYFYFYSFSIISENLSIIFNVQYLSQVDRLWHSYSSPVAFFVFCPTKARQIIRTFWALFLVSERTYISCVSLSLFYALNVFLLILSFIHLS